MSHEKKSRQLPDAGLGYAVKKICCALESGIPVEQEWALSILVTSTFRTDVITAVSDFPMLAPTLARLVTESFTHVPDPCDGEPASAAGAAGPAGSAPTEPQFEVSPAAVSHVVSESRLIRPLSRPPEFAQDRTQQSEVPWVAPPPHERHFIPDVVQHFADHVRERGRRAVCILHNLCSEPANACALGEHEPTMRALSRAARARDTDPVVARSALETLAACGRYVRHVSVAERCASVAALVFDDEAASEEELVLAAKLTAGLCWQRAHTESLERQVMASVERRLADLVLCSIPVVRIAGADLAAALAGLSAPLCEAVSQPQTVRGLVMLLSDPHMNEKTRYRVARTLHNIAAMPAGRERLQLYADRVLVAAVTESRQLCDALRPTVALLAEQV